MTILTASYNDINDTIILTTYDDGRPDAYVPVAVGNRDYQEILDWVAGGGTITPFETPARLLEAQTRANQKLDNAASEAVDASIVNVNGFDFTTNRQSVEIVNSSLNGNTLPLNMFDNTRVVRSLSAMWQVVYLDAFIVSEQAILVSRASESIAINGAASIDEIDALLAGSAFGDLSPVYDF